MRNNNIFLIGMMGAGKTTLGKLLSSALNLEFKDSDHEIEKATGADIQWVFDLEGEKGFRLREQKMIEKLSNMSGLVLATGGGAVLSKQSQKALKAKGTVIYLKSSIDELNKRTCLANDKHRPLLNCDNPAVVLKKLLDDREPIYLSLADIIVETDGKTTKTVLDTIIQKI